MLFKKREKFVITQSMMAAIQTTQIMAEVLADSTLILIQASMIAEKIKGHFGKDYAERTVKTDCVFIDNLGKKRIAVAWVLVARKNGEWGATNRDNFIKLDDGTPHQVRFNCLNDHKPLAYQAYVYADDDGFSAYKTLELDYSRI
jgi:hypothetical protein